MELKDMISVGALFISIFLGPVTAVGINLWSQRRKEIRDTKMELFVTLMSHRGAMPPNPEWVRALNLIDVVFAPHAQVVALWHQLYGLLRSQSPQSHQEQAIGHKYLEMLSGMASVLNFEIQQVNIDKYYYPQAYADQLTVQAEIQSELRRILKNTARVVVEKKSD